MGLSRDCPRYDETNRMLTADPAGGELVSPTYNGADQMVVKQNSLAAFVNRRN